MPSASGPFNRDREIIFMWLYREHIWECDHLRRPFQLDDDIVGTRRGALYVFLPYISRKREASVLPNFSQPLKLSIRRRLELNPSVRHPPVPFQDYLAFDRLGLWHA